MGSQTRQGFVVGIRPKLKTSKLQILRLKKALSAIVVEQQRQSCPSSAITMDNWFGDSGVGAQQSQVMQNRMHGPQTVYCLFTQGKTAHV